VPITSTTPQGPTFVVNYVEQGKVTPIRDQGFFPSKFKKKNISVKLLILQVHVVHAGFLH
jgi:hypothetical protein